MGAGAAVNAEARPAFYALGERGWRDYVTLLHLPYTSVTSPMPGSAQASLRTSTGRGRH